MSIFGVTWINWSFEPSRWIVQVLFLTIAWEDRTLWIAVGGAPLAVYLNSKGGFSLCLGDPDTGEGARTSGGTTLYCFWP